MRNKKAKKNPNKNYLKFSSGKYAHVITAFKCVYC